MRQALTAKFPYMYHMGHKINSGQDFEVEEPVLVLQYNAGFRLMLRKSGKGDLKVEKIGRVKFNKLREKTPIKVPEYLWAVAGAWFNGELNKFFVKDR